MKLYDELRVQDPNIQYFDPYEGRYKKPCLLSFFYGSKKAEMEPITAESVAQDLLARIMVGVSSPGRSSETQVAKAYAAIKGVEDFEGRRLAVVGSVFALNKRHGLALATVDGLLEAAHEPVMVDQFGYEGFKAKCNEPCAAMMAKLGFEAVGLAEGKTVMTMGL